MLAASLIIIGLFSSSIASPLPGMVKYDQRQEGEWNVRADLENFVILVIPTSHSAPPSTAGLGLLDLLSKAVPSRGHKRKHIKKAPTQTAQHFETQAFIESKTAPYHVDISRSRNNLAKLHPVEVANDRIDRNEKLLVSPSLSLNKENPIISRMSRGFVLSMPLEVEEVVHVKEEKKLKNDEIKDKKKIDSKKEVKKEKLSLLGAEHEQCGPGYERDTKGICRSQDD